MPTPPADSPLSHLSGCPHVAVATPPFLPPLSFFAQWHRSDLLVIGDTFACSRRTLHNRARIQTPEGLLWLTVPVDGGQTGRPIRRVTMARHATDARLPWPRKLARTLRFTYGTAPFYAHYAPKLEAAFVQTHDSLGDLNETLLQLVGSWLGVTTPTVRASALTNAPTGQSDVLAAVPGAVLLEGDFAEPPRYAHNGAWTPGLSVVDALMAVGPQAGAGLAV